MTRQRSSYTGNRGVILIAVFLVITVFAILSIGIFSRMITHSKTTQRHREAVEAFYLAEAAADKAMAKLPSDLSPESSVSMGAGQYDYAISVLESGKKWKVLARGFVPSQAAPRSSRWIETFVEKRIIEGAFWDNAIYSAGDINFVGNSYEVNGDIMYADQVTGTTGNVTGDKTHDSSISPLTLLDFDGLRTLSTLQIKPNGENNLYTASDIAAKKAWPANFWFTRGDDGIDNNSNGTIDEYTEWVPNVVYIETDLVITGNEIMGGFLVVGGNIINNVELKGDVTIDGCIYTRGYFENKGGGNSLNVLGGIWAGDHATLRGNAKVEYNGNYMNAIRDNVNPSTSIQMISWREVNY